MSKHAGSAPAPAGHAAEFGPLLRAWRTRRGESQLSLSLRTGVSARHVSYLETGRAGPSRDMVLALAGALDVPLRERNLLLQAAGFAALYQETPLDAERLGAIRAALALLLDATEPNPTFVVNRRYDVLQANRAGRRVLATFVARPQPLAPGATVNMARLLIADDGMRPCLDNWAEVARKVLGRTQRELGAAPTPSAVDAALLATIEPVLATLGPQPPPTAPLPLVIPVRLRRGDLRIELFTTIATLGTPLDITLQDLRIETLFPADAASKAALERLAADGAGA